MLYLQIILSTSIIYLFLVLSLRVLGKRQIAQLSTIDLVFVLLISNSVQNAMVNGDNSLLGGVLSALTLFVLSYILKFIQYKYGSVDALLQGKPVLLIYKGDIRTDNLLRLKISKAELEQIIREHGVGGIEHVDLAVFEKDGNISVLADNFTVKTINKRKIHKVIKQPME